MCDTLDMNTHLPKPVKEEKEPEKVEQKEEEKKEEEKEKVPFFEVVNLKPRLCMHTLTWAANGQTIILLIHFYGFSFVDVLIASSSSSYDRLKTKRKRRRKRMRRRQRKRMRNLRKPSERLDGREVAPLLCLRHCHDRPCGNRRHKRKLRITTLLHVFFFLFHIFY